MLFIQSTLESSNPIMDQVKLTARFITIIGILIPGVNIFGFFRAIVGFNLRDPEVSCQYFNDNAMNVALPCTYPFLKNVLDEFKIIYQESGAPLPAILIAGDEVPHGLWEMSPAVVASRKIISNP